MKAAHFESVVFVSGVFACSAAQAAIVGYVNLTFQPGDTLFVNPLDATSNQLSAIIASPPEGTTVSFWNSALSEYGGTATFSSGSWSSDPEISAGEAARLYNPSSAFTQTFVGQVVNPDGTVLSGEPDFVNHLPTPMQTGGTFLLGSAAPLALNGKDVFLYVTGRLPVSGEQVRILNTTSQTYTITTYDPDNLGMEDWSSGSPSLGVGQAAFFVLVPEPTAIALLAIGGLGLIRRRRT